MVTSSVYNAVTETGSIVRVDISSNSYLGCSLSWHDVRDYFTSRLLKQAAGLSYQQIFRSDGHATVNFYEESHFMPLRNIPFWVYHRV